MLWRRSKVKEKRIPQLIMKDWVKHGNEPFDLFHPVTYRQKIQWSKYYNVSSIKTQLSDKVCVRQWVAERIGEEHLIPVIGVYNSAKEIDFDSLPEQFVIKMNYSSGLNIIVKNKSLISVSDIKKQLKKWRKNRSAYRNFEMQYRDIVPKILIEQYLDDGDGELKDYKFLCFNGMVYYCWMDFDRYGDHRRNIYDTEWVLQPWIQRHKNKEGIISKPENFDEMLEIAKALCKGFDHVRVDLYNVNGQIYFGEMTFTNGNGLEKIIPQEYDVLLGNMWPLNV